MSVLDTFPKSLSSREDGQKGACPPGRSFGNICHATKDNNRGIDQVKLPRQEKSHRTHMRTAARSVPLKALH